MADVSIEVVAITEGDDAGFYMLMTQDGSEVMRRKFDTKDAAESCAKELQDALPSETSVNPDEIGS